MAKKEIKNTEPASSTASTSNEFELIRWDKPTKIFVGICVFLFVIGVAGKFHFSHAPIWYQIFGETAKLKKALIFGQPQTIRSDEWLVEMNRQLNQAQRGFPISNESVGALNSPYLTGAPILDWTSIFKPYHYGYMFFDIERGWSFLSLFNIFFFLISFFLFLKSLLNNNFLLSFFGTLWIYISSDVQWWSIQLNLLAPLSAAFVCAVYLLRTKNKFIMAINAFLIVAFLYNFIYFIYPPRQIPLSYLFALIFIVYSIKNYSFYLSNIASKAIFVVLIFGTFFALMYNFYVISKETIEIVGNTVYPGKRVSIGGGYRFTRIFSEFLFYFLTPEKVPADYGNICEASNFLMFFPVVILLYLGIVFKSKIQNIYITLLSVFVLFLAIYIFLGIPEFLAKVTLFTMVPSFRLTYTLGIASIILTLVFIEWQLSLDKSLRNSTANTIIILIVTIIGLGAILFSENSALNGFFKSNQIIVSLLVFAGTFICLAYSYIKEMALLFLIFVCLYNVKNLSANPLSSGLDALFKNPLHLEVKRIMKEDPEAKFVVFGQFIFSDFIKATGATVLSGTKFVPDFKKLKVLDPIGRYDSVYNRYAHVVYNSYTSPNDTVVFQLAQNDLYSVYIDPCSPKLKDVGVKYVVFVYEPQSIEVRCMDLVNGISGYKIYKIKN